MRKELDECKGVRGEKVRKRNKGRRGRVER